MSDLDPLDRQKVMAKKGSLIAGGLAALLAVVLIVASSSDTQVAPTALAMEDVAAVQTTTTTTTEVPETSTSTTAPTPVHDVGWAHDWGTAPANLDGATSLGAATGQGADSTAAPSAGTVASGPAPVSIPRPVCANNVGSPTTRTAPFTGLSATMPSNLPAVVVKVSNNDSRSRAALIGVDQADIVFEQRIEAAATRFFTIFHSQTPANVGPVRSGRTTDIELSQNLNRPVFGYSGSNAGVASLIQRAANNGNMVPFINTDSAPFARDSRFRAPDNLFVDPEALGGCGGGGSPTPIFRYTPEASVSAQPASSVSLDARSAFRFDWNGDSWTRSQSGSVHATRTGAVLAPDNVVVLFVDYSQSDIDASSVDARSVGTGAAWVFRDGTATIGTWRRDGGQTPYVLTDSGGTPFGLKPGQTWVVLAPAGSASWQ